MENNADKMARLPKWAQDHILTLERAAQELRRQRDELENERQLATGESTSDVTWEMHLDGEHEIPSTSHIKFYLDRKRRVFFDVSWTFEDYRRGIKSIDVTSSYQGIQIRPCASNRIRITMEDF